MKTNHWPLLPAFCFLAALGAIARSFAEQTITPDFQLPELIVHGKDAGLPLPGFPLAVLPADEPGALTRIEGEQLRSRQLYTVEDPFRNVPGVYVRSQFAGTSQARIIVRGFGLSGTPPTRGVRLLQDGIPMTFPDGQFLPQNIDYRTIEGIDIFRGPSLLRESAGSLGGALNFDTYTSATAPHVRLRAEAGSYDNLRLHGAVSGTTGDLEGYFAATHASQDGYRLHTFEDAEFFNGNVGWRLSGDSELRLFLTYSDVDGELAGPLSLNDWRSNPRGIRTAAPNIAGDQPFRELEVSRAALRYRRDGEDFRTELSAWLLYSDYQTFRPRATEGLDFISTAPGLRGYHQFDADLAGLNHTLTIGGEVYGESRPTRRVQLNAGQKGKVVAEHDMEAGMAVATLSDEIHLAEEWKLGLTMQPQHHWRDVSENLNGPGLARVAISEDFDSVAGRAELGWSPGERFGAWAAVSYQEEPPILDDMVGAVAAKGRLTGAAGNDLDAQTARTAEIGCRGGWAPLMWDITFFRSEVENEVIRTRPPAGPDVTLNARGETIHQGIEALIELALLPGCDANPAPLSLLNVVNLNNFRFNDDPDFKNCSLPAVPDIFLQTELFARLPDGWFVGAGMETAPDGMFADYADTLKTPGYTIFHLRAGRQIRRGLDWFISLENVFDQDFVNSVAPQSGLNNSVNDDTAAVFSGMGRRWQIGLEFAF